jgi:hypothetical protein
MEVGNVSFLLPAGIFYISHISYIPYDDFPHSLSAYYVIAL